MTAPTETAEPPVAPDDGSALIPTVIAVVGAYLAVKQLAKGPWRNVAAELKLVRLAGNSLDLFARRTVARRFDEVGKTAARELWRNTERAVGAGVDAGIRHLTLIGQAARDHRDATAAQSPGDPAGGAGDTTTEPPRSSQAQVIGINRKAARAAAADLADTVSNTTTQELTWHVPDWEKVWHTQQDQRVRDTHRLLSGTAVPTTGAFTTTQGTIRFPHDPAAPVGLTRNCRCWVTLQKAEAMNAEPQPALVPQAAGGALAARHHLGAAYHRVGPVDPREQ